ncbi:MAG: SurA N-terminal domain-containing protein [Deltaproteobacteria bacterium]|nr:SurA N-terminal domain-containing protein [Deltaproteobacteria bacterium]
MNKEEYRARIFDFDGREPGKHPAENTAERLKNVLYSRALYYNAAHQNGGSYMMRPFLGSLLASVSAVLIAFSPAGAQQNYQLLGPNDAVTKVNGVTITKGQLEGTMNKLLPFMTYHSSVSDERFLKIQKKALNTLIETELIYDFAKKNKLDKVDKKEIDKALSDVKEERAQGGQLQKISKRTA